MLNRFSFIHLFALLFLALPAHAQQKSGTVENQATDFLVLCYHDVQDDMRNANPGVLTITTKELINQFSWLREHNYNVISLDDLVAARAGKRALPEKAVLLTFDDGYVSIYDRVLPLLRLFNYSAVVALVGDWMDAAPGTTVNYGNNPVPRERFLAWSQVRELLDSGLVELASHSYDLHHGVLANPQGNRLPAASSRVYDAATARYESDTQYTQRLHHDLRASVNSIHKHTGQYPRAMVWPYGAYNQQTVEITRSLGMDISLTLDDGPNRVHALDEVRRNLIGNDGKLSDILPALHGKEARRPERVVHIDLDYVYDADPAQQERNLGMLIERVLQMKVSTVYLQAFADPDGDGAADALYFNNRHLPVRADLFGRASWQLRTRAGVNVYAWMPVLAYRFPDTHAITDATVRSVAPSSDEKTTSSYHRLSPFAPEVRRVIGEIYEDLAKYTDFAGLLFHDDAVLNDFEDAGEYALRHYTREWGLAGDVNKIRAEREQADRWAKAKTAYLIDFTRQIAAKVRRYRPGIKTARNIYARVVLQPESEHWFAQSYPEFLHAYDYSVVMAMPGLENISDKEADAWLRKLAGKVVAIPGALDKTIFELQAKDWRDGKFVDTSILGKQMHIINSAGIFNFGYYPDNFLNNQPALNKLRPFISLETFPYERDWR
jgi:biofilm PGA synthesis lipoprotein PgaB